MASSVTALLKRQFGTNSGLEADDLDEFLRELDDSRQFDLDMNIDVAEQQVRRRQ